MSAEMSAFSVYSNAGFRKANKTLKKKEKLKEKHGDVINHNELKKNVFMKREQPILNGHAKNVSLYKMPSDKIVKKGSPQASVNIKRAPVQSNLVPSSKRKVDENNQQFAKNKVKKAKNVEKSSDSSLTVRIEEDEDFKPVLLDSVAEGRKLFAWLINPVDVDDFFKNVWEKKPLHIKRKGACYYNNIISSPTIDNILRKDNLEFTKNIDITSYTDGKRETHNPVGRALPHIVWDYYLNGCSVRLLNPQTYIHRLHLLNSTLQEYFNSFVGANAYLTPPDSQGFAPHYDDIEAFILQIEGKKKWRVYPPRNEEETLPRISSKNFDQSEIGNPIWEGILNPGDLLYFPRGFIHQAVTVEGEHSLHVTLSCYQKHSWADLMEKMVSAGLQMAIDNDVELRRGLPLDIYDHLGMIHSDANTQRRTDIVQQVRGLFMKILDHLPIDGAVDQMNKNFMHDALPPIIMEPERQCTVFGDSDVMTRNGAVINRVELSLDTKIRLTRAKILRMVMEDEVIRLYYYLENSKEYHGNEPQFLEIEESMAPAVETLIQIYPEYVSVEQLEAESDISKIQLASTLWEKGLVMVEYPLPTIED